MKARLLSMKPNLPKINFQQVFNSRHAGLLPAGYTLVSGSSSRRHKQQKQFPSGSPQPATLLPLSAMHDPHFVSASAHPHYRRGNQCRPNIFAGSIRQDSPSACKSKINPINNN
jgi:hypothetical protein